MNAAATRKEFVGIFYGTKDFYDKKNKVSDNTIPDAYAEEICTFYRAGVLAGNDEVGTFAPNSNIKRSEVAVILIRMYDADARLSVTLE